MPIVTYSRAGGETDTFDIPQNESVMRGAKANGVPGIDADCGGVCACATCHVYVDPSWIDTVGRPGDDELEMLNCANDVNEFSRLSCQIMVRDDLDGLVVHLPLSQR